MTETIQPMRRRPVSSDDLVEAYNREAAPVLFQTRERVVARLGDTITVTEDTTLKLIEQVCLVDASSAPVTITLPPVADTSMRIAVKKTDGTANAVTVATDDTETIDGSATYSLPNQYDAVEVVADGSNWFVL